MRHAVLRLATAAAIAAALLAGASCARRPQPTREVKVAVLDGRLLEAVAKDGELTTDGWWFSQRKILKSGNDGLLATEAVSREFRKLPGLNVYDEEDMVVFLAQRDRLAQRSFPSLNPADRAELLQSQSPVDYGRALGVDFVLVPIVEKSNQTQNQFTSVWSSRARVRLEFWDVLKGERVWEYEEGDRDYFDSRLEVMEDIAEDAAILARRRNVFGIY
ncbi:MAG: hypothetical protein SF028_04745 [Candidatus Sumerlaeia bacterium]|nr:hypothetical protein [Candidatus Sumerlaeia bacterium]